MKSMHPLAEKHFKLIEGLKEHKGPNKKCAYFPCHSNLEDCTFCFCPLYPCEDVSRGGYWLISDKIEGGKVWACEKCVWIHTKENVKNILENYESN